MHRLGLLVLCLAPVGLVSSRLLPRPNSPAPLKDKAAILVYGEPFAEREALAPAAAAQQADRNVITREQIAESGTTNAYDAIRRLRPAFMQRRRVSDVSGTANRYPTVYLDGTRRGAQEDGDQRDELEQIPADQIQEIRYLSGPNATTRFGTGHSAGAILVTTRR